MRVILLLMLFFWLTACQEEQSAENINQNEITGDQPSSQDLDIDSQSDKGANTLSAYYQKSAQILLTARPTYASVLGVDASLGGNDYNAKIGDYSPEAEKALRHSLRQINKKITNLEIKDSQIKDSQAKENKQVMQQLTRYFSGHNDFEVGYIDTWMGLSPFIINQINGPLIDVPDQIITNQRIESIEDAEDYIARLDAFNPFVQSVVSKLAADTDSGWIPPKVIIEKSIRTLSDFVAPEVTDHPLYTVFADKLNQLTVITNDGMFMQLMV